MLTLISGKIRMFKRNKESAEGTEGERKRERERDSSETSDLIYLLATI